MTVRRAIRPVAAVDPALVTAARHTTTGVLDVLLGVAILAGDPSRFVGPSFLGPMALAPLWVWGVAFALCGAIVLSRPSHPRRLILAVTAGLYGVWTGSLAFAFLAFNAPATGAVVYTFVALSHLFLVVGRVE